MTSTDCQILAVDCEEIVDRIYEVALEPALLEESINYWFDSKFATEWMRRETYRFMTSMKLLVGNWIALSRSWRKTSIRRWTLERFLGPT